MAQSVLKISGMSCQHCVRRVKEAIDAVKGVSASDVAVGSATVTFAEGETSEAALKSAVTKAGYTVE